MANELEEFNDNSLMTFGNWKGTKMIDVPADYLLFLLNKTKRITSERNYARDNRERLEKLVEKEA